MNKLKVAKLVKDIKDYVKDLKEQIPVSEKKLRNKKRKYLISFLIQQTANGCISLGNHIISSFDLEIPSTSVEIFEILAKNKFITHRTAEDMKRLVKTRNVITHRYTKLSLNELAKRANEIEKTERFVKQVLRSAKKKL